MTVANLVLAVVLGVLRIAGVKNKAFQACAHLYMGGLCTAWYYTRQPYLLFMILALSGVEVMCFIYFKYLAGTKG